MREPITLLDLIQAVQDEASDDREAVAALRHLLDPFEGQLAARREPARISIGVVRAMT